MKTFKEYLEQQQQQQQLSFKDLGIGSVYHNGEIESAEQIDPFRIASKQNKKGRNYGGFYVGPLTHAKTYPGASLIKLEIDPDARVLVMKKAGSTDRFSVDNLKSYVNSGIDMIWGKDIRGFEQGLILNNKIIAKVSRDI